MGKDCNLPKPQPGKFTVEHRAGRGWLVIGPDGAVVAGPFGGKDNALTNCVARQRAADLAAKRMVRPCMCCGHPFMSEGIHNRLCTPCRSRDVAPDPLHSARERARQERRRAD